MILHKLSRRNGGGTGEPVLSTSEFAPASQRRGMDGEDAEQRDGGDERPQATLGMVRVSRLGASVRLLSVGEGGLSLLISSVETVEKPLIWKNRQNS